ncbi:MAG: hypothetical protein HYW86_03040 [Candidatus Roizmanbacteria bacterium]|nr:MAG: hypothetical protein HYW86_03040 [Candidatus Roizmanbacteria bacterium]
MSGFVADETRTIDVAIRTIQEHLDKEARNRSLPVIKPRALCPIQKVRLVNDLAAVLEGDDGTTTVFGIKVFGIKVPSAISKLLTSIHRLV